jgi:hypothetical protein
MHIVTESADFQVYREPDNWVISNETVTYVIRKENGILKVYTQEKWTYQILEENGKLNIYDVKLDVSSS